MRGGRKKETHHFAGSIGSMRIGIRSLRAVARPGVPQSIKHPVFRVSGAARARDHNALESLSSRHVVFHRQDPEDRRALRQKWFAH